MPAARRRQQQHRASDDERGESDGTREPLEIAAEASSESLQTRQSAEIAFGETPQDASRVVGRIAYQALRFARQLGRLFLYPRR